MFDCELTVEDGDRRIEFHLRIKGQRLPGYRSRAGWRDGGDPGESSAWELARVWCLGLRISSGSRSAEADVRLPSDQLRLGNWCAAEYRHEITGQLAQMFGEC